MHSSSFKKNLYDIFDQISDFYISKMSTIRRLMKISSTVFNFICYSTFIRDLSTYYDTPSIESTISEFFTSGKKYTNFVQ